MKGGLAALLALVLLSSGLLGQLHLAFAGHVERVEAGRISHTHASETYAHAGCGYAVSHISQLPEGHEGGDRCAVELGLRQQGFTASAEPAVAHADLPLFAAPASLHEPLPALAPLSYAPKHSPPLHS